MCVFMSGFRECMKCVGCYLRLWRLELEIGWSFVVVVFFVR